MDKANKYSGTKKGYMSELITVFSLHESAKNYFQNLGSNADIILDKSRAERHVFDYLKNKKDEALNGLEKEKRIVEKKIVERQKSLEHCLDEFYILEALRYATPQLEAVAFDLDGASSALEYSIQHELDHGTFLKRYRYENLVLERTDLEKKLEARGEIENLMMNLTSNSLDYNELNSQLQKIPNSVRLNNLLDDCKKKISFQEDNLRNKAKHLIERLKINKGVLIGFLSRYTMNAHQRWVSKHIENKAVFILFCIVFMLLMIVETSISWRVAIQYFGVNPEVSRNGMWNYITGIPAIFALSVGITLIFKLHLTHIIEAYFSEGIHDIYEFRGKESTDIIIEKKRLLVFFRFLGFPTEYLNQFAFAFWKLTTFIFCIINLMLLALLRFSEHQKSLSDNTEKASSDTVPYVLIILFYFFTPVLISMIGSLILHLILERPKCMSKKLRLERDRRILLLEIESLENEISELSIYGVEAINNYKSFLTSALNLGVVKSFHEGFLSSKRSQNLILLQKYRSNMMEE